MMPEGASPVSNRVPAAHAVIVDSRKATVHFSVLILTVLGLGLLGALAWTPRRCYWTGRSHRIFRNISP